MQDDSRFLESQLDSILQEEYKQPDIKDIKKETGLPLWLLEELSQYGYINECDKTSMTILKTIMYCFNSQRFLKSAVGNLSSVDKSRLFRNKKDTRLRLWINTKVSNLKNDGKIIKSKNIYNEICSYFPSVEEQGYKGYCDILKYINNAKRQYLRKRQR